MNLDRSLYRRTVWDREWDEDFLCRLGEFLVDMMGARPAGLERGMAGSQEITQMAFAIGDQTLLIETETYMGITLIGPQPLVDAVADRLAAPSD